MNEDDRRMKKVILKYMKIKMLVPPLLLVFLWGAFALAHGVGLTLESVTPEGYEAYLDVSAPAVYQNEPIRLDFEIWTAEGKPMEFTDLWVRIEKEKGAVFAGPIARARLGATGFTTTLPFAGDHTIYVRFHDGEDTITETSFILPVAEETAGAKSGIPGLLLPGAIGVLLGSVGMAAIRRIKPLSLEKKI